MNETEFGKNTKMVRLLHVYCLRMSIATTKVTIFAVCVHFQGHYHLFGDFLHTKVEIILSLLMFRQTQSKSFATSFRKIHSVCFGHPTTIKLERF